MATNIIVKRLNKKYYLMCCKKIFKCQVGEGGIKISSKKIEGDKATPIGKWDLRSIYYRSDKILRPKLKKKNFFNLKKITKNCGWCDDINSNLYNKYINIKYLINKNVSYEKLWREDDVYDLVIVISYNIKPTIKNKGSAIFIHCSFSDYRSSAGCIALKKKDLNFIIQNIKDKIYIKI